MGHHHREVFLFARARRETEQFEQLFWSGQSLDELYGWCRSSALRPWPHCSSPPCASGGAPSRARPRPLAGVQHRIERVMDVTISREMDRLERRLLFLATVGSTAPFIGLFGTVWGIMTSFQSIAVSKNTSLAVVAPGIAEALFATALGLLAAIPAVIFYNKFSAETGRLVQRLEGFSDEFVAIVSRQIDLRTEQWALRSREAVRRNGAADASGARR